MADEDQSDAPSTVLSEDARAGLAALSSQRLRRHSRLYLRTQESVRDLVDSVHEETGADIVEIIEYAVLNTYGSDH